MEKKSINMKKKNVAAHQNGVHSTQNIGVDKFSSRNRVFVTVDRIKGNASHTLVSHSVVFFCVHSARLLHSIINNVPI